MTAERLYNLSMVFEKTNDWNFEEITLTNRMLCILFKINGERSLAKIYEELKLTYESLFSDLLQLHDLHLIKVAEPAAARPAIAKTSKKMKKGYYRGTAFETAFEAPPGQMSSHKTSHAKIGYYRGTAFELEH